MNILEKLLSQPHPLAKREEPPKITPTNKVQPPKTEAEIRKEKRRLGQLKKIKDNQLNEQKLKKTLAKNKHENTLLLLTK